MSSAQNFFLIHWPLMTWVRILFRRSIEGKHTQLWGENGQSAWMGYFAVLIFVLVLGVVLLYEWRSGALDFGPQGMKILQAYKKLKK